jgi:beta-lactamase regulating signal transducer with metallopeptidase domain/archaellum component FlaC
MESLVHAMLGNAVVVVVLAVMVAITGRVCRRPALIHGLWLIVMLKLVTPPVVPVSLPVSLPVELNLASETWSSGEVREDHSDSNVAQMSRDVAEAGANESWNGVHDDSSNAAVATPSDSREEAGSGAWPAIPARAWNFRFGIPDGWSWEHLVLAVVLSGAVGWWLLAYVRIMRFERLMQEIDPAAEEWQARTALLAGRLGLYEAPSLCLVPGRVPPMLWAIGGRPRLLVPSELWSETSVDQRTALLLHELAHLKRRDHWVRWLELIVGGLYWWHPAVWWGRRLLREAEEQCCDAWVVWAMPQGAKTYATALLAAIEFVSGARTAPAASSAASGNGHVSCLKRRLKMIVRARTPRGLCWGGRLAVLGTAALLLPLAPSWGQKSELDRDQVNDRAVQNKHEQLLARFFQGDGRKEPKKDEGPRDEKSRATAERFEESLKALIEKVTRDLGPVGEELRKALEKSIAEIHEMLKKEGVTSDDLRRSLEKSHEEMRKAFEKGGTVNRELRESMEKSRRDLQQNWDRTQRELRSGMRERLQARRQQERGGEVEKGADQAKTGAEIASEREELGKARSEVRTLEQQLREANRRLVELQRRTMQRGGGPGGRRGDGPGGRIGPGRTPDDQPTPRVSSPGSPKPGAPPAEAVQPRRAVPPVARQSEPPVRRPRVEAEGRRGPEARPADDARLRELENKLERVLRELEGLKADKKSQESKESGSRSGRPVRSGGTPVIL